MVASLAIPASSSGQNLRDICGAVSAVSTRHTVNFQAGGAKKKMSEVWASGKLFRLNFDPDANNHAWAVSDGHWVYSFIPEAKRVLMALNVEGDFPQDTLPGLARSLGTLSPKTMVRLRKVKRNGKSAIELTRNGTYATWSPKGGRQFHALKTVWFVDPKDKLPREVQHFQSQAVKPGDKPRMILVSVGKIDYPKSLPAGLFDTTIPPGWRKDAMK